jgi:hypothetical protein
MTAPAQCRRSEPRPLVRALLVAAGCLALALGTVGVFLPLLPTTPFLLLAAACFIRSSDRLYRWLVGHRWFGAYIRNYREHRAMTRRAKLVMLVLLWGVIGHSAVMVSSWGLRGVLAVVAVGVTVHLLHLRTMTPEPLAHAGPGAADAADTPGARGAAADECLVADSPWVARSQAENRQAG